MKRAQILAGFSIAAIALAFPAMSDAPKAPPLEPVHVPYERTCQDTQITVYFSKQESVLSSYAVRSLNTAGDQLAGCAVSDIEASVVSADAIDVMAATVVSARVTFARPLCRPLKPTRQMPSHSQWRAASILP